MSNTGPLAEAFAIAQDLIDLEREEPVCSYVAPTTLESEIDFSLGQPVAHGRLMDLLRSVVETTPRTGSARFFNQLFGGRDDVATAAEVLSVMLNSSMYTFKVAGPHALIGTRARPAHDGQVRLELRRRDVHTRRFDVEPRGHDRGSQSGLSRRA